MFDPKHKLLKGDLRKRLRCSMKLKKKGYLHGHQSWNIG